MSYIINILQYDLIGEDQHSVFEEVDTPGGSSTEHMSRECQTNSIQDNDHLACCSSSMQPVILS